MERANCVVSLAKGKIAAAATGFIPLKITAPSCNGVFPIKIVSKSSEEKLALSNTALFANSSKDI